MSVIRNSTHFNLSNKSNKFLEITVSADQNSSFRIQHKSSYIIEKPNESEQSSLFAWAVHSITNWTRGSSMNKVTINIPAKETVQCDINSNGHLEFTTNVRWTKSFDHNEGSMIIPPENQGGELHLVYAEHSGIGYKENGDVALEPKDIHSQSIIVSSIVKTMEGHTIEIFDNTPSTCRVYI